MREICRDAHAYYVYFSFAIIHMNNFIYVHLDAFMGFNETNSFRTCLENGLHGSNNHDQLHSLIIDWLIDYIYHI